MRNDDEVCKTSNYSDWGWRLARSIEDCTYKKWFRCVREVCTPEKKFDELCMEAKVDFDELRICCNGEPWVDEDTRIDVALLKNKIYQKMAPKDCCLYPGSFCQKKDSYPCCGKKHGLIRNFKCLTDYEDKYEKNHPYPLGHCWYPGFAGFKNSTVMKKKKKKIVTSTTPA
jgi:hypothetical protein